MAPKFLHDYITFIWNLFRFTSGGLWSFQGLNDLQPGYKKVTAWITHPMGSNPGHGLRGIFPAPPTLDKDRMSTKESLNSVAFPKRQGYQQMSRWNFGSRVGEWDISPTYFYGVYWGYNPLNHLITSFLGHPRRASEAIIFEKTCWFHGRGHRLLLGVLSFSV